MLDPVIHVIDDDDAARESLEFLIRSANLSVTAYDSATAFLRALPQIPYGCIITDVRMPGLSGIELLRHLKDAGIKLPVIVVTGHGDVPIAVEAMKLGAVDFFEKPFDGDKMVAAVQSALSNSRDDADRDAERRALQERLAALTPRERDVLKGLVAGKPNKVIAYDLGISPRTVEIYRANVMTKMKSGSLSELVRMALHAEDLRTKQG
jgi:two-component system, LuxR family, response regulator FixJ